MVSAGRLIPRVLERPRRQDTDAQRDRGSTEGTAEDMQEEVEESGNRNIDVGLDTPGNVSQSLIGRTNIEEGNQVPQDDPFNEGTGETDEEE